jgi:antirestriction protein
MIKQYEELDTETRERVDEIIEASHLDFEVFEAWWSNDYATDWADIEEWKDKVEEAYIGEFMSLTDLGVEMEAQGILDLSGIPESLRYYFDHQAWARDLELGGDVWSTNFHYFWGHV